MRAVNRSTMVSARRACRDGLTSKHNTTRHTRVQLKKTKRTGRHAKTCRSACDTAETPKLKYNKNQQHQETTARARHAKGAEGNQRNKHMQKPTAKITKTKTNRHRKRKRNCNHAKATPALGKQTKPTKSGPRRQTEKQTHLKQPQSM